MNKLTVRPLRFLIIVAPLFLASVPASAQNNSADHKGVDSGDYNIQQTVEVGYRATWINGNQDTYNTFVNLGEGVRLLDYTLEMRSLDHRGIVFDNLSFSGFGFGGDPNDVSRLSVSKNNGTISAGFSGATRISGITTYSPIR